MHQYVKNVYAGDYHNLKTKAAPTTGRRTTGPLFPWLILLKDFIVNSVRKVALAVGLVIALSMLEVNIGPFLAAIGMKQQGMP